VDGIWMRKCTDCPLPVERCPVSVYSDLVVGVRADYSEVDLRCSQSCPLEARVERARASST
jgi:hypothetical protein